MKYRYLGNSGLKVSEICLGVMTFGGDSAQNELATVAQKEADLITSTAIDLGVNFFDTADVYSGGVSESVLGKALGNTRKDVVVSTKVRFAMSNKPNDTGLSRSHIIKSCENSLRRLGTDYIDLYQIHSYDPGTPMEETLRALDHLVKSGKVRYIGCSNLTAWQTMKALAISEKLNLEKFITTQLYYSIGSRDIEQELVPLCIDQQLGILCWSPLSGGFFTGKFRINSTLPADSRRSNRQSSSLKYWPVDEEKGFEIVEQLERIGNNYDKTIAQTALNWLLRRSNVASVIIGARNIQQLTENIGATDWQLVSDDVEFLDTISKPAILYPKWHQMYSDER
ncbi:MAG: aldo/keto reductase [Lentimicrobiaceae bacterium]|jgi:aryl-alcohol dehydrogenase-like predicted oxidoreductase